MGADRATEPEPPAGEPASGEVAPGEVAAFAAWRLFLQAHAALVTRLDAALQDRADLPLLWYDVLVHVGEAPGRRIRLRELQERVFFSQSTVSRLAARLEGCGLVERCVPDDDRRTVEVRLTADGARRLRAARAVAIEELRGHFVAALAPGDAERLRDILGRLAGHARRPGLPCGGED